MSRTLPDYHVCCLEQPLDSADHAHWPTLANLTDVPLMADESLLTYSDGEYLAANDLVDYFNIRISKNGGLIPSLRLAALAARHRRRYQLGAMVGESGILAAAGRKFMQLTPKTSFTEICYGTFLLQSDLVKPNLRFKYRGRITPLTDPGLGVQVSREKITQFLAQPARKITLA